MFVFNNLQKGGLNHIIFRFHFSQCFYYSLFTVDKLVFRYTHSWRDVAHNMVPFRKIYLLMMIIVKSAFRWTVEVAWL